MIVQRNLKYVVIPAISFFIVPVEAAGAEEQSFEYLAFGPQIEVSGAVGDFYEEKWSFSSGGAWIGNSIKPQMPECDAWDGRCLYVDGFKFAVPQCTDNRVEAKSWSLGGVSFENHGEIDSNGIWSDGETTEIRSREQLGEVRVDCFAEEGVLCELLDGPLELISVFMYSCERGLLAFGLYLDVLDGNGRVYYSSSPMGLFSQSNSSSTQELEALHP